MIEQHLICIDIDGTLIDGRSHRPPQENLDAICDARKRGHKIFINTGRSWANIPQELRDVLGCFDGICCANGSYIRTNDTVLRNITFSRDILRDALEYFTQEDDRFCLFEGETHLLKTRECSDLYGAPGVPILCADEMFSPSNRSGFNVFSCEGQLPQQFYDKFDGRINIFQCDVFADCTPLGCSKALGLQFAAEYLSIPMERTVAIGDSANDLPMMQCAAISVAMLNAAEDIRAQADYVTDSNVNCGVAKIIHKLFLSA